MLEIASISGEDSENSPTEENSTTFESDFLDFQCFFEEENLGSFAFFSDPDRHIYIKKFPSDSSHVSSDKTNEYLDNTGQMIKPIEITTSINGYIAIEESFKAGMSLLSSENYKIERIKPFKEYSITDRDVSSFCC